jgi:DUF1365 family protein
MTTTVTRAIRTTPTPDMASAIGMYTGTVRHRRASVPGTTGPLGTTAVPGIKTREFAPKLFLAYLDVDALPASLDRVPLWSARRAAPVHFRRRDFFDGGDQPLGDGIRDLVASRIGRRPTGRIDLLAHLRTFGWLHNPLAVYYCWSLDTGAERGDELDAVVLEVTNTPWGERHWYVFDASAGATRGSTAKEMYVSPFLPMDVGYRVTWTPPREHLTLKVAVERAGESIFEAELDLRRESLDQARGLGVLVRYPLATLRVTLAIYRQALLLFLTRAPLYRHLSSAETPVNGDPHKECAHG